MDTIHFFLSKNDPNVLVIITMQERVYGTLSKLKDLMEERVGLEARLIDMNSILGNNSSNNSKSHLLANNFYSVVFHHKDTPLDVSTLGPEISVEEWEHEDDDFLLGLATN